MLDNLALGRGQLDRLAHRRSDASWFADVCAAPDTFVVGVCAENVIAEAGALSNLRRLAVDPAQAALLGEAGGRVYIALMLDDPGLLEGSTSLRELGAGLSDNEAAVATAAVALHQWHRTHTNCARCGAATVSALAGWERQCTADGSAHYPRTDPAVIVLITDDDDRLLLARQHVWPERRFSLVAGYVEPGETAEHAVEREVLEEVGLDVRDIEFLGSQPWPFPASLMLCYRALATHTDFVVDGIEIAEAQWLSRSDLAQKVADGSLLLPSAVSVARRAIEYWFGSDLTD